MTKAIFTLRRVVEFAVDETEVLYKLRMRIPGFLNDFFYRCSFGRIPFFDTARNKGFSRDLLPLSSYI